MRKKSNIFLILIVLVGMYILYGIVSIIKNIGNFGLADYIIVTIMYAALVVLFRFLFKKYKIYSNPEYIDKEQNKEVLKTKTKMNRILLTFLIFIGIMGCIVYSSGKREVTKEEVFANSTNITTEQAEKALNVLKECGIEKVDSIEHDTSIDNMEKKGERGYRVNSGDVKNVILYLDKTGSVSTIRWVDNNLYARNKIIAKITDFTLTIEEMSNIQVNCEKTIEGLLKSPKAAEFPNINNWSFIKKNEVITVWSYVDAENSFGAKIRSEFQFKIKNSVITSLIFEGKEYIK